VVKTNFSDETKWPSPDSPEFSGGILFLASLARKKYKQIAGLAPEKSPALYAQSK